MYPFLSAFIAIALLKRMPKVTLRIATWTLIFFFALESTSAYPHYLSFFNLAVGGAGNGHRYLLDSNLDWGQDLIRLKHWVELYNTPAICLSYFGTADPSYYGITYRPLPHVRNKRDLEALDCVVAISVEHLYGVKEGPFAALQSVPRKDQAGDSIYIFDLRRRGS